MNINTRTAVIILVAAAIIVSVVVLTHKKPIVKVPDQNAPAGLPLLYKDSAQRFSIYYAEGYAVDSSYIHQGASLGRDIEGVKFTIPAAVFTGTNLSSDSALSVEEIPVVAKCSASLFLESGVAAKMVKEGATTYSFASTTGAGAGNRYEETVYALPGTKPCVAVRYMVHYGVIENYTPGAVKEFDKAALISQFDAIRHTLVVPAK